MKFGVCRGMNLLEVEEAAKAGADYIETNFGELAKADDEKLDAFCKKLKEVSLPCIAANCFIPGDMKLVGENVDYKAIEAYLDKGFKNAEKVGLKKVVFGSGKARSCDDSFDSETAYKQVVEFLKEYVVPRAKETGIIITVEPLKFCETKMIHLVSDGIKLARECDFDSVYGLADLYHVYNNDDDIDGIGEFEGELRHAHIAEPVNRRYPKSTDSEQIKEVYKSFLNSLQKAGCDTCSVEAGTDDFFWDASEAIAFLKSL